MTDTIAPPLDRPALGVGTLIGESFRTFGARFVALTLVTFLPLVLVALGTSAVALLAVTTSADPGLAGAVGGLFLLLGGVAMLVGQAMIVQIAYDARLGRRSDYAAVLKRGIAKTPYIVVLGFVLGLASGAGLLLLVVPGLWIFAALSLTVPAIVVEDANWRGLGRSYALTRGYRWPLLGLIVVMYLPAIAIEIVAGFVGAAIGEVVSGLMAEMAISLFGAVGSALFNLALVLAYARLREIKEGISVDRIADVFA
ncbi:MAG: hypothetical protein ACFBWO_05795 [Paracoccaceae bacterium]